MLSGERPDARAARIFDIAMILHAEHEMNASTFTARVVAGTGADLTSAVVAAIAALSGPLHGGANAAAMELFEQWGSPERTPDAVRELLERKAKLFGFGHPLYRAYDPRALILKQLSEELSHGRRRAQLVRDHRRGRADGVRGEAPVPERRSLLGLGLPLPRHPDRPLHAGLRGEPHGRLGRARARAARRQQDHPALGDLRRRAAPPVPAGLMTLADAAAEADQLAEEGKERELSQLRAQWDEELESAARAADFRERAVAYRAIGQFRFRTKIQLLRRGLEDDSPAVRGSSLLALEKLSRDHPGVVNDVRPLLHELLDPRRERGRAAARRGLAEERLAAARHDSAARIVGDDDEQPRELREAAAKVAQLLRRKGK